MGAVPSIPLPPLQDPKILKKIFKGSSLADVKVYRQVCTSWNEASSEELKKLAKLRIGGGPWGNNEKTLESFMALVDNEMCTLTNDSFPNSVQFFFEDVFEPRFWERFGNLIKSLELQHATFSSLEDFRDAIYHSCPNLEKLEMSCVRLLGVYGPWTWFTAPPSDDPRHLVVNRNLKFLKFDDLSDERFCFSLFEEMFNHFPNFEALHVTCSEIEEENEAIFRGLQDWLQGGAGRGGMLKEVSLSFNGLEDPERTAEILTSENLTLVNLSLADVDWSRDSGALQMILEGHATTLQKLSLEGTGSKRDSLIFLPEDLAFGRLEELRLSLYHFNLTNLWRCVPNLKKLVLDYMPLEVVAGSSIQKLQGLALSSCEELEIRGCRVKEKSEISRQLIALLPNMKKLKLDGFTNEVFSVACQSFPKLVELTVSGEDSLDSAITGLDTKAVERINQEGRSGTWNSTTQPKPGLRNLKKLKILSIRSDNLGPCSARFGIELLPALQQLRLEFLESDEETWNAVWKPLLAKFPWKGK